MTGSTRVEEQNAMSYTSSSGQKPKSASIARHRVSTDGLAALQQAAASACADSCVNWFNFLNDLNYKPQRQRTRHAGEIT